MISCQWPQTRRKYSLTTIRKTYYTIVQILVSHQWSQMGARHSSTRTFWSYCYCLDISVHFFFFKIIFLALSNITVRNHFGTKRSLATLFQFVAHFPLVRIEDSSRNRFALNFIQRIACFIVFS